MVKNWCNVLTMEGVIVCGHHPECRVTFGRGGWTQPLTNGHITISPPTLLRGDNKPTHYFSIVSVRNKCISNISLRCVLNNCSRGGGQDSSSSREIGLVSRNVNSTNPFNSILKNIYCFHIINVLYQIAARSLKYLMSNMHTLDTTFCRGHWAEEFDFYNPFLMLQLLYPLVVSASNHQNSHLKCADSNPCMTDISHHCKSLSLHCSDIFFSVSDDSSELLPVVPAYLLTLSKEKRGKW